MRRAALFLFFFTFAVSVCVLARLQPAVRSEAPDVTGALDGTWELVSVVEGGKPIPIETVKKNMIRDARIVIDGALLAFSTPDGKGRTLAFVTDPKATPKRIDLAGTINVGGKGIYLRDGDSLLVCVGAAESDARPTEFFSQAGQDNVQLTFRRVNALPAGIAVPEQPAPAPQVPRKPTDAEIKDGLVGTWGHQTSDRIVKATFNADGSFSTVMNWKKGLKKVFDAEERNSGKWDVKNGTVVLTVTASTESGMAGQVKSYRVDSITAGEVIYIENQSGERRIEWKLR
jgi:uncharacterized protein (TIGR03067 family)